MQSDNRITFTTCEACNGTGLADQMLSGRDPANESCETCDGKGVISKTVLNTDSEILSLVTQLELLTTRAEAEQSATGSINVVLATALSDTARKLRSLVEKETAANGD